MNVSRANAFAPDFQSLFESQPGWRFVIDRSLHVVSVSQQLSVAAGITRERWLGRSLGDVFNVPPGKIDAETVSFEAACERAWKTGQVQRWVSQGLWTLTEPLLPSQEETSTEIEFWLRPVTGDIEAKSLLVVEFQQPAEQQTRPLSSRNSATGSTKIEQQLEAFLDQCPATAFLKNALGQYVYVNDEWKAQFIGQSREWYGLTDFELWPAETATKFRQSDLVCLQSGQALGFEEAGHTRTGEERHWLVFKFPVARADEQFVGGIALDITEQQRAVADRVRNVERQLNAQVEQNRLLKRLQIHIERLPLGYLVCDTNYRYTQWNPSAERLFGWKQAEVLGQSVFDVVVPPESREVVATIFERLRQGDMEAHGACENVTRSGQRIYCEWHNTPLFDEQGQFTGILSMARDVTARHNVELKTQHYVNQLRLLGEVAARVNASLSAEEILHTITRVASQLIGAHQVSSCLVIGDDWSQAISAANLSEEYAAWRDGDWMRQSNSLIHLLRTTNRVFRMTQAELEVHPAVPPEYAPPGPPLRGWLAAPLIGRDGRNLGLIQLSDKKNGNFTQEDEFVVVQLAQTASVAIVNAQLYEESVALHESLEQSLAQLNLLVDSAPVGVAFLDRQMRYVRMNNALSEFTGIPAEEHLGKTVAEVMPAEVAAQIIPHYRAILEGRQGASHHELSITTANTAGERHWWRGFYPVQSQGGAILGIGVIGLDITERRRAEEEVRRLNAELEFRVEQRTAQLEQANHELEAFSYSVSHDLRAPLRAVDGFSKIVLQECSPLLPPNGRELLELIRSNAQQMGQLIDDLLSFSRLSRQPLRREAFDTAALVRQCWEDLHCEREGRQIELNLQPLPHTVGDRTLLKQVWMNLLSNALKYTRRRDVAKIEVLSRPSEDGVDSVVFEVRDNGVGFDMRYIDKLFQVFQRLHRAEDYEGTGVGLAIVQRIIVRHGGRVWAKGQKNVGSTFSFVLDQTG